MVKVHFSQGQVLQTVSGKICDVGTDFISVRKNDGTVVTILKNQIHSIEWPNQNCNPCPRCHKCSGHHDCVEHHEHCDCEKEDGLETDDDTNDDPNDEE